jgi:hypothetical protein
MRGYQSPPRHSFTTNKVLNNYVTVLHPIDNVTLIEDRQCSSICAKFRVSTALMLIILVYRDVTLRSAYFNITLRFEAPNKYQPFMIKALPSFKMSRDVNCQLHSIELQKT